MTTGSRRSEKQNGKNKPASARPKFRRAGTITGAVLVSGILLTAPNPFKFINNNQSNVSTAYGDSMAEPKQKITSVMEGEITKKKSKAWQKEVVEVYQAEAEREAMYEDVYDKLKGFQSGEKKTELFDDFYSNLNEKQQAYFLVMAYTFKDDKEETKRFIDDSMAHTAIMLKFKDSKASEMLPDAQKRIGASVGTMDEETIGMYNKIVKAMGNDEISKAVFIIYLDRLGESDQKYAIKYFHEKIIEKKGLNYQILKDAKGKIVDILKMVEIEAQEKPLEDKFEELVDPKSGLLNERERTLLLHIAHRLGKTEPEYVASFIGEFYDIAKVADTMGQEIYTQVMKQMTSAWGTSLKGVAIGDAMKEFFEKRFEFGEKIGMEYSILERIMLFTAYHYSYEEAFASKPSHQYGFFMQLMLKGIESFAEGMAEGEKKMITAQEYAAMYALMRDIGEGKESDASTMAKQLLFTPMLYAAGLSLTTMVTFTARYFVTWFADLISPGEEKKTARLTLKAVAKGALNDPFSVMEFGTTIGAIGDMYKRTITDPKTLNIKTPLNVLLGKGLYNNIVDYETQPEMAIQLWRIIPVCVNAGIQEPKAGIWEWYDSVTSYVLNMVKDGTIKNGEDFRNFVDALERIGLHGGYDLADVTLEIHDHVGWKKKTLDETLADAQWLARNELKITAGLLGTLRKVDEWRNYEDDEEYIRKLKQGKYGKKWVQVSKAVPKKEKKYYAKITPTKKSGGKPA